MNDQSLKKSLRIESEAITGTGGWRQRAIRRFSRSPRLLGIVGGLGLLGLVAFAPVVAQTYTVTDLATLPYGGYPTSINNSGQIVGYRGNIPTLWQPGANGTYTAIDLSVYGLEDAESINDYGQIVGTAPTQNHVY